MARISSLFVTTSGWAPPDDHNFELIVRCGEERKLAPGWMPMPGTSSSMPPAKPCAWKVSVRDMSLSARGLARSHPLGADRDSPTAGGG